MKYDREVRKCDHCGKEATYDPKQFGGTPFSGWWELKAILNNIGNLPKTYDYCCKQCLIDDMGEVK